MPEFACVWSTCDKKYPEFDKDAIIIHNRDDHQSFLIMLPEKELRRFIKEVKDD